VSAKLAFLRLFCPADEATTSYDDEIDFITSAAKGNGQSMLN